MYTDHYGKLFDALSRLGIVFELTRHEAVRNMDDCYRVQTIPENAVMPKNIFLCNRQQTAFYLFVCSPFDAFRTAVFSKALGVSRLSFGTAERLQEMLGVASGAVTPLALMFDEKKNVRLILDQKLLQYEIFCFHPLVSDQTVRIRKEDFLNVFLPYTGHEAEFVRVTEE